MHGNKLKKLSLISTHYSNYPENQIKNVILAFDLTEKSFLEVPLPVAFEYTLQVTLKILTESPSLCCMGENDH